MATALGRRRAKEHPRVTAAILTALGYGLVFGTFAGVLPIYPDIGVGTVDLLSHLIAVVNTVATVSLVVGWRAIHRGDVQRHRRAMLLAFVLIVGFLVLYLLKVGGGGEKYIVAPALVTAVYRAMLAVHILLSAVAVPVVLYALVLGLTHTPAELRRTAHARVGRIAAASWIVSLVLGVVTYVLLNHVYGWTYVT